MLRKVMEIKVGDVWRASRHSPAAQSQVTYRQQGWCWFRFSRHVKSKPVKS